MTTDRKAAIERLSGHDLAVYAAKWSPDCTRLETMLDRERIPHRVVDIEADPAAADRLVRETGKRAIPYILVDGSAWVRGCHRDLPERLNPDLLLRELGEALSGPLKENRS